MGSGPDYHPASELADEARADINRDEAPKESRVLRIAKDELTRAQDLLNSHIRDCKHHGCFDCRSLAAHRERCERQVALLAGPDTETEALF
jgi:hypothetical protein